MSITKDTAKDWLPLIAALAEGKQLQNIALAKHGLIEDVCGIEPEMFCAKDYRVKPSEPRHWWINVYLPVVGPNVAHISREEADQAERPYRIECLEVVEVNRRLMPP